MTIFYSIGLFFVGVAIGFVLGLMSATEEDE